MYQYGKRRKNCCPSGHLLQSQTTDQKLEPFLQTFPSNFKIHMPSALSCTRCTCTIYADEQPTYETCQQCNFNLCRKCIEGSSPVSSMDYDMVEDDFSSRKRKGRDSHDCGDMMSEDSDQTQMISRHNNARPNYALCPRVSYQSFPEPSHHGWTFTGSCFKDTTEFCEKRVDSGMVHLDFHFMSGTVRTVLNHYVDGPIVLYQKGRSLLPEIYHRVLQNPQFTDLRYRRRCN